MSILKIIWWLIKIIMLPFIYLAWIIEGIVRFLRNPISIIVITAAAAAAFEPYRKGYFSQYAGEIDGFFRTFNDPDFLPFLYEYRYEITWGALLFGAWLFALLIHVIMAAFPARAPMKRPIIAPFPLIAKNDEIKPVAARISAPVLRSRFRGKLSSLNRYLPPKARAALDEHAPRRKKPRMTFAQRRAFRKQQRLDQIAAKAAAKLEAAQQRKREKYQRQETIHQQKLSAARQSAQKQQEKEQKRRHAANRKIEAALLRQQVKAQRDYEKAALKAAKRGEALPPKPPAIVLLTPLASDAAKPIAPTPKPTSAKPRRSTKPQMVIPPRQTPLPEADPSSPPSPPRKLDVAPANTPPRRPPPQRGQRTAAPPPKPSAFSQGD